MSGAVVFSAHGVTGEVQPLAGMLGPVTFTLADGRRAQPFQVAPWADEPGGEDLPGVLRRLRGDWACVPFGMPTVPAGLPADWTPEAPAPGTFIDPEPHGFGANHAWTVLPDGPGAVAASIDYPAEHPIARLERRVAVEGPGRVVADLIVTARRDCRLPVGLHPTLRLPDEPGMARLEVDAGARFWSFPVDCEPGASRFRPDQRDRALDAVLDRAGAPIDPRVLPFTGESEDLGLLLGTGGTVGLSNLAEGWRIDLAWDEAMLPGCLVWFSNRGRKFAPWNGRHRALGLEPIASAFDLGTALATGRNPLADRGVSTAVSFEAGRPRTIRLTITCRAI